jgi:hypothetical protein
MTDKIIAVLIIVILLYLIFKLDWVYAVFIGMIGYVLIDEQSVSGGTLLGSLKNISGEMALVDNVDPFANNNYAFIITGRKIINENLEKDQIDEEMKKHGISIVALDGNSKQYKYVVIPANKLDNINEYLKFVKYGGKLAIIDVVGEVDLPYLYERNGNCITIEFDASVQKSDIKDPVQLENMVNQLKKSYPEIKAETKDIINLINSGNHSMLNIDDLKNKKDILLRCSNTQKLDKAVEVSKLLDRAPLHKLDISKHPPNQVKKDEYEEYVTLFNKLHAQMINHINNDYLKVKNILDKYVKDTDTEENLNAAIEYHKKTIKLFDNQLKRIQRILNYLSKIEMDVSKSKPMSYYRYLVFNVLDHFSNAEAVITISGINNTNIETQLQTIKDNLGGKYDEETKLLIIKYINDMLYDDGKVRFSSKGNADKSAKNFVLDGWDSLGFMIRKYDPSIAIIEKIDDVQL